ncbi:hypothetical protein LCGC14_1121350 [marine sediment metagenome]|uniref:Uncharacterized protein n=1 Tax=marine sediment metagenome TaxID=412755 RepID=A0A0F9M8N0_9ZZZZ
MSLILETSSITDNARQYAVLRLIELLQQEILQELKAQTLALAFGMDKSPEYLRRNVR